MTAVRISFDIARGMYRSIVQYLTVMAWKSNSNVDTNA